MMTKIDAFNKDVFNYISEEYGNNILKKVQKSNSKTVVKCILNDSRKHDYPVDKTANKIVAMLKLNP